MPNAHLIRGLAGSACAALIGRQFVRYRDRSRRAGQDAAARATTTAEPCGYGQADDRHHRVTRKSRRFAHLRYRPLQVRKVETLGESLADWAQKRDRLAGPALVAQKARAVDSRTQCHHF